MIKKLIVRRSLTALIINWKFLSFCLVDGSAPLLFAGCDSSILSKFTDHKKNQNSYKNECDRQVHSVPRGLQQRMLRHFPEQ